MIEPIKKIVKDTGSTTFTLLKIMIPVSIIVKILEELGLVEVIGKYLAPVMNLIGLPGEFGLVWATAMITNIYGSMIVFFSISVDNTFTVAQVTVLGVMILLAHTLPIELRIAQKAGLRIWFVFLLRVSCAFVLGAILNITFSVFSLFQGESKLLWSPGTVDPSIRAWIISQLKNYVMIFLIIFSLIVLMEVLKQIGVIKKLNKALEPALKFMGMSKAAAPITIIGTTLGISYGGGLIIKEAKSGELTKKDAFLSLSLMSISHSLIEDTLLMLAIGASIFGVFFARIFFTIVVMVLLIKIMKYVSDKVFNKYFVN